MDFFAAEERAKKRTRRLLILFALGLLGTIVATYAFARIAEAFLYHPAGHGGGFVGRGYDSRGGGSGFANASFSEVVQPGLLAFVAVAICAIVGIASLVKWAELRQGGSAVANGVGGRRVDPHTTEFAERRLLNVVEEMAIAAGIPVPSVYILEDEPEINAFAAGLTTSDAVVAVSRGALDTLSRDELQGVIGHEFSHILNGDMRMNMRLTALIFGILVMAIIGRGILYGMRRDRDKGAAAIFVAGVSLVILGYVGYFFGRLIQAAVSRQREYLADASSVQFTRNPGGLVGALRRIGASGSSLEHHQTAAIGHFFFAQSFRSSLGGLLATHPPLPARIRAIDPQFDEHSAPPLPAAAPRKGESAPAEPPPLAEKTPMPRIFGSAGAGTAPMNPLALLALAGTLPASSISDAQNLIEQIPARILAAARSPAEAPALLLGLLLSAEPAVSGPQRAAIGDAAGIAPAKVLSEIEAPLRELPQSQKIPVVLLALPSLNTLDPSARANLDLALDRLVHTDGRVTTFGYALQKIVRRTLLTSGQPSKTSPRTYSFPDVSGEIAVVLSALAHASSGNADEAVRAFIAGAAQLRMLEGRLGLLPSESCGFAQLDSALDRLGSASGPIKRRLLTAAAAVINADGILLPGEIELFRAIAAALDVPLPAS